MQANNHTSKRPGGIHRGFTIVELLMVIGILAVLMGITVSAVSGSIQRGRVQKARAICTVVQQGIATYYAQKDEWPVSGLENKTLNADIDGNKNTDKPKELYLLEAEEVRTMVRELVEMTRKDNPVLDVSGLYVSTSKGEGGSHGSGMDFLTAIHGSKNHPDKIKLAQMYFGYPDPETGYFRRFKMTYSPATDSVSVKQQ